MSQRSYIYRNLFGNRSQRSVSLTLQGKPEQTEMAVYYHGCQGRKLQQKNFSVTRRRIDKE